MLFFIDTANLDEIKRAKDFGLIDGVTTNPTLFAKEGGDWRKHAERICREVGGPVSLEVIGLTAPEMLHEARELIKFGPNVVVKIPMIPEGMKAVRELRHMDVATNVTLVFSAMQALVAAKAGAAYVSPFVGRLDAVSQDGMALVSEIITIFRNYGIETKTLAASVRHPRHVLDAAVLGADAATIPFPVLEQLMRHPLTDSGLATFLSDWQSLTDGKA